MFSVFPKYLKWSWLEKKDRDNDLALHKVIELMRETYNKDKDYWYYTIGTDPHIIICSPLTANEYNVPGTYTYECFHNKYLTDWIVDVNKEIVSKLTTLYGPRIDVLINIRTCMLNKLVDQGKLSHNYAVLVHDIFVANVWELRRLLGEERMNSLPF